MRSSLTMRCRVQPGRPRRACCRHGCIASACSSTGKPIPARVITWAWRRRKAFPGPHFLPLLIAFSLAATVLAQPLVDARQSFVNALIRVLEGVPATFGDERASVSTALAAMEMGLRNWDQELRRGRDATPRELSDTEKHFGLGLTYLDRGRSADAVAELTSALNAGPSSGDIRLIRG